MSGEAPCPPWLLRDWLLLRFGGTQRAAVSAYRRFVEGGIGEPGPWEQLRHQVFLGSETFVQGVRWKLPPDRDLTEVPRAQRRPKPKPKPKPPFEYARAYRRKNDRVNTLVERVQGCFKHRLRKGGVSCPAGAPQLSRRP